jgi:hypothetical protein
MLEAVPAIRRIETDRDDLAAFDVVGMMTGADLENLFGLLEAAYALHSPIDVLVRLVECEGLDRSEVDPDTVSDGTEAAGMNVRRCAVVGDANGLAGSSKLFVAAGAGETRHFAPDDEPQAWTWIEAGLSD